MDSKANLFVHSCPTESLVIDFGLSGVDFIAIRLRRLTEPAPGNTTQARDPALTIRRQARHAEHAPNMKNKILELELLHFAAPLVASIENRGYELYAPERFSEVPSLVKQMGRQKQSPMLSVTKNDFLRSSAFYLFLLHDGRAIGGAAARVIDLKDEPFDEYLRRSSQMQYGRKEDPIKSVAQPLCHDFSGCLIYLGELELAKHHRGDIRLLGSLVRVLQLLSAMRWPDFSCMYAFVPESHAKLGPLYGFTTHIPRPIEWNDPIPEGRRNDHSLLATPRSHFLHLVKTQC